MHSYPRNLVIIRRAVVYYARSAHAFSAGIKCQHCTRTFGTVGYRVISANWAGFAIAYVLAYGACGRYIIKPYFSW